MALWDFLPWVGPEEGWIEDLFDPTGTALDKNRLREQIGEASGGTTKKKTTKETPAFSFSPVAGATSTNPQLGFSQLWDQMKPQTISPASFNPAGISPEWQAFLDAGVRAQMAPLESILQAGQAEIQRRAGEQQRLLGLMPGTIKENTNTARQGIMDMSKMFAGSVPYNVNLGGAGVDPMMGTAPALAGLETIAASRQSDLPYLDVAGRQFNAGQQLALNLAHQQAAMDIQKQRQADLIGIAMAQFQADQDAARFNASAQNDWNRSRLGAMIDMGQLTPPVHYDSLAISPDRGFQLRTTDPERANMLVQQFPDRWGELVWMQKNVPPEEWEARLQKWVGQANPGGAQRVRAELASLFLTQFGAYDPGG